jgi:hypothetical protein
MATLLAELKAFQNGHIPLVAEREGNLKGFGKWYRFKKFHNE